MLGNLSDLEDAFYTKSELKEKGWTDGAIASFLGEPDREIPNRYKSLTKLFLRSRVVQAMQSEDFAAWQSKTQARRQKASERMKSRMDEQRNALINELISKLKVNWLDESIESLIESAIWYWVDRKAAWLEYQGKFEASLAIDAPTLASNTEFLARITGNYVRHYCSNYDDLLANLSGRIGQQQASAALKAEIQSEAAARFGELQRAIDLLKVAKGIIPAIAEPPKPRELPKPTASLFRPGQIVFCVNPFHSHWMQRGVVLQALHSSWVKVEFEDGFISIQNDATFDLAETSAA